MLYEPVCVPGGRYFPEGPDPIPGSHTHMTGRASLSAILLLSLCRVVDTAAQAAAVAAPLPGEVAPAMLSAEVRPTLDVLTPTPAVFSDAVSSPAAVSDAAAAPVVAPASARGLSGALRVALIVSGQPVPASILPGLPSEVERPRWVPIRGTVRSGLPGEPVYHGVVVAPENPGIWSLDTGGGAYTASQAGLTYITLRPFTEKRDGRLNGYHIGNYPTEGSGRTDVYAPPEAFIEVTPENQDLQISEHFRLRQFLTKDQFDVWPKYVVLNLQLIDKLELVIQELNAMGVRALSIHVMSGFRTPQYNGPGGDGRAALSRHMYGDAADIWVDGDENGYIDDLNGDGRTDIRDAELLLRAVERVEQRHPELTGGAGLYESNSAHGPFVHVDVRGSRARW